MKLWMRFALAITLVVCAVLATASGFFYYSQKQELFRQIRIGQEEMGRNLAKVCEETIVAKEDIALLNYFRSLAKNPDVAFADFIGPDGTVKFHTEPGRLGRKAQAVAPGGAGLVLPIVWKGETLGEARIAFREEAITRRVSDSLAGSMRRFARSVMVGSLGLGLAMAVVISIGLTRPIRRLVNGARLIGKGKLDTRVALKRSDELGDLASEFNDMAVKLGQLDRMKEEFLHSVTHDLRNPLASILGYSEMLLQGPHALAGESHRKYIGMIKTAGAQLNELISTILDLAKLEAGMMKLKKTDADLCQLAREVHQTFVPMAQRHDLKLEVSLPSQAAAVSVDLPLIRRVWQNFVTNAVKFTPPGGVITISARPCAEGWRCEVADTGPGIPPEHMRALFAKFSQVPGIESDQSRGTGLGLAICKSTAEAHGGRVGVESEVGKGSCFFFILPAKGA